MTQEIRHTQRPGSADAVLLPGEIAYSDSNTIKVGDGSRPFSELPDFSSNSSAGDNKTIQTNSLNKIEAHGTINKNPSATYATNEPDYKTVYDWIGTNEEYAAQNIATTHPEWLCFITNDAMASMDGAYTRDEIDAFLATKADGVGSAVMTSGAQTIQGEKTFLNGAIFSKSTTIEYDVTPADNSQYLSLVMARDKNNKRMGIVELSKKTNGDISTYISSTTWVNGEPVYGPSIESIVSEDGQTKKTATKTPSSATANDTQIATTAHVINVLKAMYPIGAIFIGTTSTCPMAQFFGTWELVAADRSLQGSSSNHSADTTIAAGLPNITGEMWQNAMGKSDEATTTRSGALSFGNTYGFGSAGNTSINGRHIHFDASNSNTIYGSSSTVQPSAYVVNVWRRTA